MPLPTTGFCCCGDTCCCCDGGGASWKKKPAIRDQECNCSELQSGVLIPGAGAAAAFLPKLKSKPSVAESADERASASISGLNNLEGVKDN